MTESTTEPEPETDEQTEKAPEEPQESAEEPTTTEDGAEAPEEPQEPAEAIEVPARDLVVQSSAGSLTLRPNQKELDVEQHWALKAIGIDTQTDPGVIPHLRAFVHMCQIRGLDPWAREAYLIGRGKGDKRKYTMQTGIDGYRKMAKSTGRFIRVKTVLWTGTDDDDRSYRPVEEDGDYVMKRVWYDQWPESRGHPGAAKVVIEHYDEYGSVVTTPAVADWSMYAPYNDLWEYDQRQRKRVQRFDSDGKPIKVLAEMWTKGAAHMLSKCAEALAHRKAFPAAMSGIYVTEEMHRLDQIERDREAVEKAQQRREAYGIAQREQRPNQPVDDAVDGEVVEEPTPVGDAAAETVEQIKGDADDAQALLLAELGWQGEVLGQKPEALARRRIAALRKNLDDFTAAELHPVVNGLRAMAAEAAARQELPEAEAYAAVAVDGAGPIDVGNLGPEDEPDQAEPDTVDLEAEHPYEDVDGTCLHCGLAEDVGPHPEDEQ